MLQLLRHFMATPGLQVVPVLKISRFKNKKNIESLVGHKCSALFPWMIFPGKDSLYLGPDFKLNTWGLLPRVVMIHDMVVFEEKYNQPDFYLKGIREMTEVLSASALDAVLVNSEFTKSQVLKFFPHLQGRIHVTYLGCNRTNPASLQRAMTLPEKYILFLGTLEKRKNVLGVIRAFEVFKSRGGEEKLVLGGAWGFASQEIQKALEESPFKKDIVHLSYVPDENISELYQRAQVFFFPSWYEGFGIPVLEAMSLGCPVITSQGGALQEVCGDAALLVDPAHPEQMAEVLTRLLSDDNLREDLKKKGLERSKNFTWEKCAQDTLQVFKKVLRKS